MYKIIIVLHRRNSFTLHKPTHNSYLSNLKIIIFFMIDAAKSIYHS